MSKRCAFYLLLIIAVSLLTAAYWQKHQVPPCIRLHILANSNDPEDQRLKYLVRDRIVTDMKERFASSGSLDESRRILKENIPLMEEEARHVLQEEGVAYEVKAVYGLFSFPTRFYGQYTFPAGSYEAVRLVIGRGEGANWWCVLFPPLCFVSGEKAGPDLQTAVADQETVRGLQESGTETVKIQPAFKAAEIFQELMGDR